MIGGLLNRPDTEKTGQNIFSFHRKKQTNICLFNAVLPSFEEKYLTIVNLIRQVLIKFVENKPLFPDFASVWVYFMSV